MRIAAQTFLSNRQQNGDPMKKSTSIGSFAWRGANRLALILAAAALPAAAQLTPTVTTLSSTLNPTAQIVRFTAHLQFAPAAGAYPTGTTTFRYADTSNVLGTAKSASRPRLTRWSTAAASFWESSGVLGVDLRIRLAYVADPGVSGLAAEIANGFLPTSLKRVKRHHQGQECQRGLHQPGAE